MQPDILHRLRTGAFGEDYTAEETAAEIERLRSALSRMLKMYNMLMDEPNIGASIYSMDCLLEMNEAPIQAHKALAPNAKLRGDE